MGVERMRLRKTLMLLLLGSHLIGAADLFVGTWKIDVTASKLHYAPSWTNTTMITELRGQNTYQFTFVQHGADGKMQTTHDVRTFDGKERPSLSDPGTSTVSELIDAHTRRTTWRRSGKTIGVDTTTISPDGKRLTSEFQGLDSRGHRVEEVRVYERN